MAWLNLFVSHGEDGDDHHVKRVAEIPSLTPVGKGRQRDDAGEESRADQDLRADLAHGGWSGAG